MSVDAQRSNYHSNVLSKASKSFLPFAQECHVKACFRLALYALTCLPTLPRSHLRATYATICAPDLRTFCPRVFGINEHFSQESALREPFFRAPDWTYTGNIRDYLRSFFRPRSLGINHHFSQKSALKQPFFRAPDWTYARGKLKCFTTCPGATRL